MPNILPEGKSWWEKVTDEGLVPDSLCANHSVEIAKNHPQVFHKNSVKSTIHFSVKIQRFWHFYAYTVWKFENFNAAQILREIICSSFGFSKTAILNFFIWLRILQFWKFLTRYFQRWNFLKNENSVPLKWSNFQFLSHCSCQIWFHVMSVWQ